MSNEYQTNPSEIETEFFPEVARALRDSANDIGQNLCVTEVVLNEAILSLDRVKKAHAAMSKALTRMEHTMAVLKHSTLPRGYSEASPGNDQAAEFTRANSSLTCY